MRPLEQLHALAERAAAEHQAMARACETRWNDELELRRQQLAQAAARLLRHG